MGEPRPVERTPLQRWVIGAGTVVAAVSAVVAFTAGGSPHRTMPSPFDPRPAPASPAHATTATCTPAGPQPGRLHNRPAG